MKQIKLENSHLTVTVDDENYEHLSKFKWRLAKSGHYSYTIERIKSVEGGIKHISMPCEVFSIYNVLFDHKDLNTLNNQKENLRRCTVSQNMYNRDKPITINATSKYKGVCWNREKRKWQAQIRFNYKLIYLGYFRVEEDAAKAYDNKALELHGEFARLNFEKRTSMSDLYMPKGSINIQDAVYEEQIRLGIQAPPKSGKTIAACSFPNPVVISLDRGLGGVKNLGLSVVEVPLWNPKFVDSLAQRTDNTCPPNRMEAILVWLRTEAFKLSKEQTLIIDGSTGLQTAFHTQYWTAPSLDKGGQIKPFEEYKQKLSFFSEITLLLKSLHCNVVYICHETADRDKTGEINGLIRPLLSGQFVDELQSHFTDWFRCLTVAKPSVEKMIDFKAKFKLTDADVKEWVNSNPTDTIYIFQTQSDEQVKCGSSTLVGAPRYILADYKSFQKYSKKK